MKCARPLQLRVADLSKGGARTSLCAMYRFLRWSAVVACSMIGAVACLLFAFHRNPDQAAVSLAAVEPGLTYTNERVARVPWSIHVLKIDRSQANLTFYSAHARGKVLGVSLIADQARAVPPDLGKAIAG